MENRKVEIYKIINIKTKKIYVGQTVEYVLNHGKYRKYGADKRLKAHISEALCNTKKNQCKILNNSIRKHGAENFIVEIIELCDIEQADTQETKYITTFNSLYPNGYNIKFGGIQFRHDNISKKKVSDGLITYYESQKIKKFENITIPCDKNLEQYLRPLNKYNNQYGWYIYIEGIKADFGGIHISLENSKIMAINFLKKLIKSSETSCCGKPLRVLTTTSKKETFKKDLG
jgi:group I intron endonuclease